MEQFEKEFFYVEMEDIITNMKDEDRKKLEFANDFLQELKVVDIKDGRIKLDTMDAKIFLYLIFSVLVEYESKYPRKHDL